MRILLIILISFVSLSLNAQRLKGKYQSPCDHWEWGGFEEIYFHGQKFRWVTGGCVNSSYSVGEYKYYPDDRLLVLYYQPNKSEYSREAKYYHFFREKGVDSLHNVRINKRKLRFISPLSGKEEVLLGKAYNR